MYISFHLSKMPLYRQLFCFASINLTVTLIIRKPSCRILCNLSKYAKTNNNWMQNLLKLTRSICYSNRSKTQNLAVLPIQQISFINVYINGKNCIFRGAQYFAQVINHSSIKCKPEYHTITKTLSDKRFAQPMPKQTLQAERSLKPNTIQPPPPPLLPPTPQKTKQNKCKQTRKQQQNQQKKMKCSNNPSSPNLQGFFAVISLI